MIEIRNFSFSYTSSDQSTLKNINLRIPDGQCVLLTGMSGCGKTTIIRALNGLIPHYYEGKSLGSVSIFGKSPQTLALYELAPIVGCVFQNPRSQFFNVDTDSELVFACENLGMSKEDIRLRFNKIVSSLHIERLMGKSLFHLSSGEKQKIACASVAVLSPNLVLMDEPSANLDFSAIANLQGMIQFWKDEGKTIVIAEHRIHYLKNLVNRVILLDAGEIIGDYQGVNFFELPSSFYETHGIRIPDIKQLSFGASNPLSPTKDFLELYDVNFSYHNTQSVLNIPKFQLPLGRATALIGSNGAGKSTFAKLICGLVKKDKSKLIYKNKTFPPKKRRDLTYLVQQEVNHQLFTETVMEELLISQEEENHSEAEAILQELHLDGFKDEHPMSLSGGQKQRVAVASALMSNRDVLIFDEPTSGLDLENMQRFAQIIKRIILLGKTCLIITHDPEFIALACQHIVEMKDGQIKEQYDLNQTTVQKLQNFFREEGSWQ